MEKVFKDSLARISGKKISGQSFLDYFYQIFIESSDEIKEKFKNTDLSMQSKMLRKSISELVHFYISKKVSSDLYCIGQSHNKDTLNITTDMYDLWLKKLTEAVEKFDDQYSPRVELAWHIILAPGIAFMKYSYDHEDIYVDELG